MRADPALRSCTITLVAGATLELQVQAENLENVARPVTETLMCTYVHPNAVFSLFAPTPAADSATRGRSLGSGRRCRAGSGSRSAPRRRAPAG